MVNFKAFLLPKVVQFILISIIRMLSCVGLCLVIGAEIYTFVHNIKGYVAGVHSGDIGTTAHVIDGKTIVEQGWCGFVPNTTVPTHTGGIFFSTFFTFINVILLFFLLVSEVAPPLPALTTFFLHWLPFLSNDSSVGFLGAAMMWISTSILSSNSAQYSIVSAWFLFVVGVLNVLLGFILGPSVRRKREIFETDKSRLPSFTKAPSGGSSLSKRKDNVSYPQPIEIGFLTPAAMPRQSYMATRPSEMVECRINEAGPVGVHRSRSGKGIVTIKTEAEEIPDSIHANENFGPPSYGLGATTAR